MSPEPTRIDAWISEPAMTTDRSPGAGRRFQRLRGQLAPERAGARQTFDGGAQGFEGRPECDRHGHAGLEPVAGGDLGRRPGIADLGDQGDDRTDLLLDRERRAPLPRASGRR